VLSYLEQNIGSIADKDFAHIGEDSTVTEDAKQMRDKDTTSIFITKKNSSEPLDTVIERDILYRVLAQNKDPSTTSLREVMNYPLIFVDEDTTIKEAICLMSNRYIQRLPIKKAGKIIGIVTLKRTIGKVVSQGMDLAAVELPEGKKGNEIIYPYCHQKFDDRDSTSKHINDNHLLNC
jgi:signal-transduction protein with cAMP-binding, CBS, and nucleotidyltransferase domain